LEYRIVSPVKLKNGPIVFHGAAGDNAAKCKRKVGLLAGDVINEVQKIINLLRG